MNAFSLTTFFLISHWFCFFSYGNTKDWQEFQKSQTRFIKKKKFSADFEQKSYFSDFDKPLLSKGLLKINKDKAHFLWRITEPSPVEASFKNNTVKIKSDSDTVTNTYSLSDIPPQFKFIDLFLEVLGVKPLQEKNWEVKKKSKNTFLLKPKKKTFGVSQITLSLNSKGFPKKIEFLNSKNTKIKIHLSNIK